jgi:hypothetical protein
VLNILQNILYWWVLNDNECSESFFRKKFNMFWNILYHWDVKVLNIFVNIINWQVSNVLNISQKIIYQWDANVLSIFGDIICDSRVFQISSKNIFNKWGSIICKHNVRWHHVSQLKANAFCSYRKKWMKTKHISLYPGLVLPSLEWWSLIGR